MKTGGRAATADEQGELDIVALLQQIYEAVDELEISVDNIDVSTMNIDMNTDELEARIGEISATPTANTLQDRLLQIKNVLDNVDENTDELEAKLDAVITALGLGATEATLAAIKAQTDKLTFVVDKLKVDASFTGDSNFGDNSSTATVAQSATSVLLKAANTDRKELILHNNSNQSAWITFNSPAVVGKGFILRKNATAFLDKSRTDVYGIWTSGGSGDMQVTEITV